jgi:DNA-binding LacI/PurR family transcriptional regulator
MRGLLEAPVRPTVAFAPSDVMALAAIADADAPGGRWSCRRG